MFAFVGTALALASLYLAAGAPTPLFVLLEREWGFSPSLLTIAFAAYAIGLLTALLVAGGLSDVVGRRPVLIGALSVEIVAMVMFVLAPDIGWIIAARVVQGIATGAATSAFTAAVIELAPDRHKGLGAVIGSSAAAGGLGVGALLTGAAVEFSTAPRQIIFGALTVVMVVGLVVAIFAAETVTPRPGALAALVPKVSVPGSARREFTGTVPGLVAAWMLAALFLGLVPSILRDVFKIDSGLLAGLVVFVEPGAAAVAGFVLGRLAPRRTLIIGSVGVLVGSVVIVAGIAWTVVTLLVVGGVVGGVGFGAVLSGSLRAIGALVPPTGRSAAFAAVFVVAYLAFGLPAIIAGQLLGVVGLFTTALGYAVVIVITSALSLFVQLRAAESRPTSST